jgi:hypothetical protein
LLKACVSDQIVARFVAPSGHFEAVVHETDGGATTEFGYYVVIRKIAGWYPDFRQFLIAESAVRADCESGLDLRWHGDDRLEIGFSSASRYNLTYPRTISIDGHEIAIAVQPGRAKPLPRCLASWDRAAAKWRRHHAYRE